MKERKWFKGLIVLAAMAFCLMALQGAAGDGVYAAGKNGFYQEGSKWVYYQNGKASNMTWVVKGTVKGETAWWYIENGSVKFVDTVAKNENGWWRIKNGKVDFNFVGVAANQYGEWYCRGGKVDFNYNGFFKDSRGWLLILGGNYKKNASGVYKGTINGENTWWNVVGGKVLFKDTIARNENGWWRIKNGKVDFNCNTIEKNENGWWYLKGGKVDFNYNGIGYNSNGWWYCRGGKVDFKYNGYAEGTVNGVKGIYYFQGSKLSTVSTVAKYNGTWVYVNKGRVDYSYTGFGQNQYGWWFFENGKLDFNRRGVYKGTVNGSNAWWNVEGGKVTLDKTTIGANSNGEWYCKNGKVEFNYNGDFNYNGETDKIKGGKVVTSVDQQRMQNKAQEYSSDTGYLILINRDDSKVMVLEGYYGNWSCKFYCDCNCGSPEHFTPPGTFRTTSLHMLYFGPDDEYRCWYATQFYGDVLFHSVLYQGGEDAPNTIIDGRLGVNTSKGCVRLQIENAKWIYNNIPTGTKVVVY